MVTGFTARRFRLSLFIATTMSCSAEPLRSSSDMSVDAYSDSTADTSTRLVGFALITRLFTVILSVASPRIIVSPSACPSTDSFTLTGSSPSVASYISIISHPPLRLVPSASELILPPAWASCGTNVANGSVEPIGRRASLTAGPDVISGMLKLIVAFCPSLKGEALSTVSV